MIMLIKDTHTWSPLGAIDISLGYRLDPEWAAGISLITWLKPAECCYDAYREQ
jgi:hypothetical protein